MCPNQCLVCANILYFLNEHISHSQLSFNSKSFQRMRPHGYVTFWTQVCFTHLAYSLTGKSGEDVPDPRGPAQWGEGQEWGGCSPDQWPQCSESKTTDWKRQNFQNVLPFKSLLLVHVILYVLYVKNISELGEPSLKMVKIESIFTKLCYILFCITVVSMPGCYIFCLPKKVTLNT